MLGSCQDFLDIFLLLAYFLEVLGVTPNLDLMCGTIDQNTGLYIDLILGINYEIFPGSSESGLIQLPLIVKIIYIIKEPNWISPDSEDPGKIS